MATKTNSSWAPGPKTVRATLFDALCSEQTGGDLVLMLNLDNGGIAEVALAADDLNCLIGAAQCSRDRPHDPRLPDAPGRKFGVKVTPRRVTIFPPMGRTTAAPTPGTPRARLTPR